MYKHRDAAITASSDVFTAATIALEGQEDFAKQFANLQQVLEDDICDINRQAAETESYLYDETRRANFRHRQESTSKPGVKFPLTCDEEHIMDPPIDIPPDIAESVTMDDDIIHIPPKTGSPPN